MTYIQLGLQNLLSAPILFFLGGVLSVFLQTNIQIPKSIQQFLTLYLLFAIGLKGGHSLLNTENIGFTFYALIIISIVFSFLFPFIVYFLLRKTTSIEPITSAAIAAHYGSISMVTFIAGIAFLKMEGLEPEGYIVGIAALMEAPAIATGLVIAHSIITDHYAISIKFLKQLGWKLIRSGSLYILLLAFLCGLVMSGGAFNQVERFVYEPFVGFLCFFLFDLGQETAQQGTILKKLRLRELAVPIYTPLIGSSIALFFHWLLKLDVATGTLFVILCASASYIAVPAAMKQSLPQANSGLYMPFALGLTFPFNVIIGIPLYFALVKSIGL